MTRLNQILIAVLAVQLIIGTSIYYGTQPLSTDEATLALLEADPKQADQIIIEDNSGQKTELERMSEGWKIANYHQLPAQNQKINEILDKLNNTQTGWPVATTEAAQKRFEVGEENYQKRITISHGDKVFSTLLLGTSPGFRQLHLRKADDDRIYNVTLNSYDLSAKHDDWLEKTLLQPKGEITQLQTAGLTFNKESEGWKLNQKGSEAISEEVEKLAENLSQLAILGTVPDQTPGSSDYQLVVNSNNQTLQYRFFKLGDDHLVRRDDLPVSFKISQGDYEKITAMDENQLVKQHEETEQEPIATNGSHSTNGERS